MSDFEPSFDEWMGFVRSELVYHTSNGRSGVLTIQFHGGGRVAYTCVPEGFNESSINHSTSQISMREAEESKDE